MATEVEKLINQCVTIISADGRTYTGVLKSFDQTINLVVENCKELVYDKESILHELNMGTFLIRGENVAMIGETADAHANPDIFKTKGNNVPATQF